MRIVGIGGTGVVTVAQVLATAAVIDGKRVRTLDQTGLAQKRGAVVSDLKLSTTPFEQGSKIGQRRCDLYLVCDTLVGTDTVNLKVTNPESTVAVVSTTEIPTGKMIVDTAVRFPDATKIRSALDAATHRAIYLNPAELALALFNDEQYTNMLLVGAAYQSGALPIAARAIEEAITLNGASVTRNLQAFRRGRQAVADPEALAAAARQTVPVMPTASADAISARIAGTVRSGSDTELTRLVALRVTDLIGYQNRAYAGEYADFVEHIRGIEVDKGFAATDFTNAVARNLYKLMAYKDEYEVARLIFDPSFDAAVQEAFGAGAKRAVRLHPPMLRAMGMKNKLALGRWANPALRTLYRMRRLRGTRLDPFGYHPVRRMERELIIEYRTLVDEHAEGLTADRRQLAIEIAELPDLIRGYEDVKVGNVDKYRRRLGEALAEYRSAQPTTTIGKRA